jgi:hypothetical protein
VTDEEFTESEPNVIASPSTVPRLRHRTAPLAAAAVVVLLAAGGTIAWLVRERSQAPGSGDNGTRGLLSNVTWFNAHFQELQWSEGCQARLGEGRGDLYAYRMDANTILCMDLAPQIHGSVWQLNVEFATPVREPEALAIARQLLPPDITGEDRRMGANPRPTLDGDCVSVEWSSKTLRAAAAAAKPQGWQEPELATATLYGQQGTLEGSADRYAGLVREIYLKRGGHNLQGEPDPELLC